MPIVSAVLKGCEPAIIRRDHRGVILRYAVTAPLNIVTGPQASDRLRTRLLRAERELGRLAILIEHSDISDLGIERMLWSLNVIRAFLSIERPAIGLQAMERQS
jgi:hypothetical protein